MYKVEGIESIQQAIKKAIAKLRKDKVDNSLFLFRNLEDRFSIWDRCPTYSELAVHEGDDVYHIAYSQDELDLEYYRKEGLIFSLGAPTPIEPDWTYAIDEHLTVCIYE